MVQLRAPSRFCDGAECSEAKVGSLDDQLLWDGNWHMLCLQCRKVRPTRSKYCRVSQRCVVRPPPSHNSPALSQPAMRLCSSRTHAAMHCPSLDSAASRLIDIPAPTWASCGFLFLLLRKAYIILSFVCALQKWNINCGLEARMTLLCLLRILDPSDDVCSEKCGCGLGATAGEV